MGNNTNAYASKPNDALPTQRLFAPMTATRLSDRGVGAKEIVKQLEAAYEGFLTYVQRPETLLLDEFADDVVRGDQLSRATRYGELIYELLVAVVPAERLRYIVV